MNLCGLLVSTFLDRVLEENNVALLQLAGRLSTLRHTY